MADISSELQAIQVATRGEQVRDAIVEALQAINNGSISLQAIESAINALDVSSVGGNGKYIKAISEYNGKISATEETADTEPTENSTKLLTSGGAFAAISTLQSNFQDGVDDVYDAIVAKGTTPASKSLSDVVDAIGDIQTGSNVVINHNSDWEQFDVIGPAYLIDGRNIWTDGVNVYYSNGTNQYVLDIQTLTWLRKTWNGITSFYGYDVWHDGNDIHLDLNRILDTETDTWNYIGWTNESRPVSTGATIWTDGVNIYSSSQSYHKVYNRESDKWESKIWTGLTSFDGYNIWTDGENVYYSDSGTQKVLNVETGEWSNKTWNGLTNFVGNRIWTDGDDIYYSYSDVQKILNKSTIHDLVTEWDTIDFNDFKPASGAYIWTDGVNVYYSNGTNQYVYDKTNHVWNSHTWNGSFTSFDGQYVWTDGDDIYYSNGSTQKILNKQTLSWEDQVFIGYGNLDGRYIWNDGGNTYYSNGSIQCIYDKTTNYWFSKILYASTGVGKYVWTDGENIYFSNGSNNYIWNGVLKVWGDKTWNGMSSFYGDKIWTDGDDIYYSYNNTQKVFERENMTWVDKTWSGLTIFQGSSVKVINNVIYTSTSSSVPYSLDKATSTWSRKTSWSIQFDLYDVFNIGNDYYAIYGYKHYKYYSSNISDGWSSITFIGVMSQFDAEYIWTDGENIYYSTGENQFVFDKQTKTWSKKAWSGMSSFSAAYIWTDGDAVYYSNGTTQRRLSKADSSWIPMSWNGLTNFEKSGVWNDGEYIYYSKNNNMYRLTKVIPEPEPEPSTLDVPNSVARVLDAHPRPELKQQISNTKQWVVKNWSGLDDVSQLYASDIWTDGDDIYLSSFNTQKVLNVETGEWSDKTWSGMTSFNGEYIWTDGDNIYYSNGNTQKVLNVETGEWSNKTWNGLTNFTGNRIWTDGLGNYYYSNGFARDNNVLDKSTSTWSFKEWTDLPADSLYPDYFWTDGDNVYYSCEGTQKVLNVETGAWSNKDWGSTKPYTGISIWTDGVNLYHNYADYSEDPLSYKYNKQTNTWDEETWSNQPYPLNQYDTWGLFTPKHMWTDGYHIYLSGGDLRTDIYNDVTGMQFVLT